MSTRVLIAGVSTRAAAESAAKAGFAVTAIDGFADLDQHPSVTACAVRGGFQPLAAVHAASTFECHAVSYLSNFENDPDAVDALAAGRCLWGNPPDVLRRVRNPNLLAEALAPVGIRVPRLGGDAAVRWLAKPVASGGGIGIRPWTPGERVPSGCYLQERMEGLSASVVFVANGTDAILLGVSRQLAGLGTFGASGFRYCGNVLDPGLMAAPGFIESATTLAQVVTRDFGLVGVNGIDVIVHEGRPCPIEVNPRWSASMELVERASDISVFGAHARACSDRDLPDFNVRNSRFSGAVGKAILYARRDVTTGDTRHWLADATVRDIPRHGDRIPAGGPICTVFAAGHDADACLAGLERRAAAVYSEMVTWEGAVTA